MQVKLHQVSLSLDKKLIFEAPNKMEYIFIIYLYGIINIDILFLVINLVNFKYFN
jgi:hypothetical protein